VRCERHDAALSAGEADSVVQLFGVQLGGTEVAPPRVLHYPALLLITSEGRVPIELALSSPGRDRLTAVMSGYAAEPNVRSLLYMTDDPRVWRLVEAEAERLGISDLIHLQRIRIVPAQA